MEQIIQGFEQALLVMDREQARAVVESGAAGLEPVTFVEAVMVPALERIGAGWETGMVSLSQVYM
ncbi:MAG: B12-binding domain-containing protein, partial [Desulfohalobiaceae bacterium]|nr:B12-binding domain-containing protein [Desulfohalobiaceae bacterium]